MMGFKDNVFHTLHVLAIEIKEGEVYGYSDSVNK